MIWVAMFRGGCVIRWDPRTGKKLAVIDVPTPHVSSCCFGGPDFSTLCTFSINN